VKCQLPRILNHSLFRLPLSSRRMTLDCLSSTQDVLPMNVHISTKGKTKLLWYARHTLSMFSLFGSLRLPPQDIFPKLPEHQCTMNRASYITARKSLSSPSPLPYLRMRPSSPSRGRALLFLSFLRIVPSIWRPVSVSASILYFFPCVCVFHPLA